MFIRNLIYHNKRPYSVLGGGREPYNNIYIYILRRYIIGIPSMYTNDTYIIILIITIIIII